MYVIDASACVSSLLNHIQFFVCLLAEEVVNLLGKTIPLKIILNCNFPILLHLIVMTIED